MTDDKARKTRPLTIVHKIVDGKLSVIVATRNGNTAMDALAADRDASVARVEVAD